MAYLIDYTVIMTVHYRLSLLRFCRGRTERVLEGSDESRLRRCRGARCGSHGRRRRQRPRCCNCRRFFTSGYMNTVGQRRGLMSHMIHGVQR